MNGILEAFIEGIGLGITLSILIGPSFFALIQTSIKNGFRSGIALAIGIFISDLLCVAIAYFGATQLFNNPNNKLVIGVMGGTILIVFGIFSFFQKKKNEEENIEIKTINLPLTILKGFALNLLNPFVILFWIGWVGLISSRYEFAHLYVIVFFSSTLITVLTTDILKAIVAIKIKIFLTPLILIWVNRIVGVILIGAGVSLVVRVMY